LQSRDSHKIDSAGREYENQTYLIEQDNMPKVDEKRMQDEMNFCEVYGKAGRD